MDDVLVCLLPSAPIHKSNSIFDDGRMIGRQIEISSREIMYCGINFDNRGVDAVSDDCGGCGANAETTDS